MKTLKYNRRVDEDAKLTIDLPESFRGKEVEIIVAEKQPDTAISEPSSPRSNLSLEERKAIVAKHKGSMPAHLDPSIDLEEEWYQQ